MTWLCTGDKPLSEQMTTQFTDIYMHFLALVCKSRFIWDFSVVQEWGAVFN